MLQGIEKSYLLESNGFTVEVTVSEKYDISQNASAVTVGLRIKSAYRLGIQYLSGSIQIDGKKLLVMDSTVSTHNVYIAEYDTWYDVVRSSDSYTDSPWTMENIAHDAEGAKKITLELEVRGYGDDDYLSLRVAATKAITLTKIPRASTVAATDANIGAVSTVSVLRSVEAYTHSIAYRFGALSGYIKADGSVSDKEVKLTQTGIPFLLPESFYTQIPDSTAGECILTVKTYSGSQQIGNAQTAKLTATASKKLCKPSVSGSVVDTNAATIALTGDQNILVRYASDAKCTISAEAKNSATIAQMHIAGQPVEENTLLLEKVDTGSITFGCTDSRGYAASATVKKTLVPYVPLSAAVSAARTDPTSGKVKLVVSGVCYQGSFGTADNAITVLCNVNNGEAIAVQAQFDGNEYTAQTTLTGLDYQRSHSISVTVADKLQTVTKSVKVGKGIPVFDWDEDDFQFHVPVELGDGCDILKNGKLAYVPVGERRVYVKLTDIGIKTFPTTMNVVAEAMPVNSLLVLDSRDIVSGGKHEISDLGIANAGVYLFFVGNSTARLSLLHIYSATSATTSYMNYGCYAPTTNEVVWIRGERQNGTYPDCRYRTAADGTTEYINPPLLAGHEYRTTERWNGKIVYKKLLAWKSTTDMYYAGTYSVPHGISNLDLPSLRIEWSTNGWALPYVNGSESLYISQHDSTNLIIKTDGNALWDAGRTFYFLMKYCKT